MVHVHWIKNTGLYALIQDVPHNIHGAEIDIMETVLFGRKRKDCRVLFNDCPEAFMVFKIFICL